MLGEQVEEFGGDGGSGSQGGAFVGFEGLGGGMEDRRYFGV